MRLQTGCPCRGRPVFLYALAIPGPVRSSPERPSSDPFFLWVRAKLPSVQADRRGEVGGGVARPEQGVCSIQMTAAHMYENRMVVIHMR